jgi:hypothetical protein
MGQPGLVERVTSQRGERILRPAGEGAWSAQFDHVLGHAAMISADEFVQASGAAKRPHAWCPVQSLVSQGNAAEDDRGIEKYLGSGMIYDIGPVLEEARPRLRRSRVRHH